LPDKRDDISHGTGRRESQDAQVEGEGERQPGGEPGQGADLAVPPDNLPNSFEKCSEMGQKSFEFCNKTRKKSFEFCFDENEMP